MDNTVRRRIRRLAGGFALFTVLAVGASESIDPYERYVLDWRAERVAKLKAESGYLNLVGLYWLGAGTVTFGASPDNGLVFPGAGAARLGRFVVGADGVTMHVDDGADVEHAGEAVTELFLADDTTDDPVTVTHGSLAWGVIQREGRYALRLRDFENPALDAFPPLDYYDIDRSYVVRARLIPFDEPRVMRVGTVIEGLGWEPRSPGVVEFVLGGETYTLEAYEIGDELFFVFGDRTNGRETYPAGRFLYAALPDANGMTYLDFNLSYSPPCAFNDFSTCPVASPRNRLPLRVTAGELHNRAAYVGSE